MNEQANQLIIDCRLIKAWWREQGKRMWGFCFRESRQVSLQKLGRTGEASWWVCEARIGRTEERRTVQILRSWDGCVTGCPRDKRGGWCGWSGVRERRCGWGAHRKYWSEIAGPRSYRLCAKQGLSVLFWVYPDLGLSRSHCWVWARKWHDLDLVLKVNCSYAKENRLWGKEEGDRGPEETENLTRGHPSQPGR